MEGRDDTASCSRYDRMVATICGARTASSSQPRSGTGLVVTVGRGHVAFAAASGRCRGPSSGHPHRRLGLDGLGRPPVLGSQPSVTEMQIQLGRGDRAMPSLRLERLDGDARLCRRVKQVWRSS